MDRVRAIRMLDHEHQVAPFADGVPVGRGRLRAHGRGGNADQRRGVEIIDPDEVCDVRAGVLADDELPRKRPPQNRNASLNQH
jgi:hypothetical protein